MTRTPHTTRIPFALKRHDITTGDGAIGTAFSPYEAAEFLLDHLTAQSVCLASGWRVITTSRESLRIPNLSSDVTASWTLEADPITASDPDGDPIIATPKKLAALTILSNESVRDSSPEMIDVVGFSMGRSLALKADLGFLEGSGVDPEITGLKNVAGIQTYSMGTDGATPTNLDPWAEAIGLLGEADAEATAIYMAPREWRTILKIKETASSNLPVVNVTMGPAGKPERSIYGVRVWLTSQLSTVETQGTNSDTSSSYVVQTDQCVAVVRQEAELEVNGSRLFNTDQSEVRGILRVDAVHPNPTAICRIHGLRDA